MAITSKALIVGIDAYLSQPLTSAVADAVAFKAALLELELVAEGNIRLLSSPQYAGGQGPADCNTLLQALLEVYRTGDGLDRFFFFFAGHGLLAYSDAARSRTRTVLMPADVRSIDDDGRLLIDFQELLDRMRQVGPKEQFYFVDACRSLDYEKYPDVGGLGWSGRRSGAARSQSVLYAVSPLGKALGVREHGGVMTTHLLQALRGEGVALDYSDATDEYVVTMESVHKYVHGSVKASIQSEPNYKRLYQLPELESRGPPPLFPLRVLQEPKKVPFTVHIDPDAAGGDTKITLARGRMRLADEFCYPPRQNHEPVELEPHIYLIQASSPPGSTAEPSRKSIDVREVRDVTIRVAEDNSQPSLGYFSYVSKDKRQMLRHVSGEIRQELETTSSGLVAAKGNWPGRYGMAIELKGLTPPYTRWSGLGELSVRVPAGAYRLQFRLGSKVFDEQEFFVQKGEVLYVRPGEGGARKVWGIPPAPGNVPDPGPSRYISKYSGWFQSGLLSMLLPLFGLVPVDPLGFVTTSLGVKIPESAPVKFQGSPFSLVVALEGDGWTASPRDIFASLRCELLPSLLDQGAPISLNLLPFLSAPGTEEEEQQHIERIAIAMASAPSRSFTLAIDSPLLGAFRLTSAALPDRVSVVAVTLRVDGTFDISENLFRLLDQGMVLRAEPFLGRPMRSYLDFLRLRDQGALTSLWSEARFQVAYPEYPDERLALSDEMINLLGRPPLYADVIEALQVGQSLYRSGELVTLSQNFLLLRDLIEAKWTDPVMSCMAWFAWSQPPDERAAESAFRLHQIASNLELCCGMLPDSRIIQGLAFLERKDQILGPLLDAETIPVLAESARALARYAEVTGRREAGIHDLVRRIPADQPWVVVLE